MISRIYLAVLFTCMVSLVEPGNKKYEDACRKFGRDPNFDPKRVLGPQWRIYYTWNTKQKSNCLAMKFHNINPTIVSRFYKDMGQYLVKQPLWSAAMLYMTIGAAKHEILFLADYGPPGRAHGVPNLIRDPIFMKHKRKRSVPVMQYQLKLVGAGKYLVIMDCLTGSVTLSKRDLMKPPYRSEIESVAKELGFGSGSLACQTLRHTTVNSLLPPPDYSVFKK